MEKDGHSDSSLGRCVIAQVGEMFYCQTGDVFGCHAQKNNQTILHRDVITHTHHILEYSLISFIYCRLNNMSINMDNF